MRFLRSAALLLPLVLAATPACRADIYGFVDEDGTTHFSNIQLDARYRLYKRDPLSRPQVSYGAGAEPAVASAAREQALPSGKRYASLIQEVAREERVDAALLHAVITVESGYNARAVSPKGAVGLMQLMPDTARRYAVRDIWDPVQNLRGGARYLRDLLGMFNDNLSLALAAYNAGEKAVIRAGLRIPPFAETRSYVPRVLEHYTRYRSGV
ncbi:MAG TPA: lytic transglycosylase domain-containing protein [Burkholderiales bacterium]|nr:lytic transglycosylase domain-containing protein [Burkholderiales bacterium]